MMRDRFNGRHSSDDQAAVAEYEKALHAVLGHRPGASAALDQALARDPDLVSAHALKGFALVTLARRELMPQALACAEAARNALRARHRALPCEVALVDAVDDASRGRLADAARRLEAWLAEDPSNVLFLKLAHALRFMLGDSAGMLGATSIAVRHGRPGDPGTGYVFGCHAFALEEQGLFDDAERWAGKALDAAPDDAWALHAASHVDEMRGRVAHGIERLEASRAVWGACNNFQYHMAWHLALFYLQRGDADGALGLYDDAVRREHTDDFRDVANAASLLWRLRLRGVDVGHRWEEIAMIARRRASETTLAFASMHHLMALIARNETEAIDELIDAWRRKAAGAGGDDQALAAQAVAVSLAEAMAGRRTAPIDFAGIAGRLHALGGSNAQRDVFLQTLLHRASEEGDHEASTALAAIRERQRHANRVPTGT